MSRVDGYLSHVEFDGQTVTISKKLRGAVSIPVASVQSVSIVPAGIGMSGIRFAVAGGTLAGPSVAFGSHKDLAEDPYAITFRNKHRAQFESLAASVRDAQHLHPQPPVTPPPPSFPPAGWYPEGNRKRWWDGRTWTDHYSE